MQKKFTILSVICFSLIIVGTSYAATYSYSVPFFTSKSGYWTGLAINNLSTTNTATVTAKVYGYEGSLLATETRLLNAKGQDSFCVGAGLNKEGWVLVESDQPLGGLAFVGDVTRGNLIYDISLISCLSTTLSVPHVAQNQNWDTWIIICNPNDQTLTAILSFYGKDGSLASTSSVLISAKGSDVFTMEDFVTHTVKEGSLTIDTTSSGTDGVSAFALYTNLIKVSGGCAQAGISAVAIPESQGDLSPANEAIFKLSLSC